MADLGYRSIEVVITNDTRGNLTISNVVLDTGAAWVQGEAATQGMPLFQYNSVKIGVCTNEITGTAGFQLSLTGLGSFPVTITASNDENGKSAVGVNGNDQVSGIVRQIDTGEVNHTAFNVQLIPGM